MSAPGSRPPFEPFFMEAAVGSRFCLFHPAAGAPRGAVLYVHPFAEEMNKSRRMVALQARAFAQAGFAVLQIDLLGCGDSSGDFGDATWEGWKADLALAAAWLRRRVPAPLHVWGLRLGATLALDAAAAMAGDVVGWLLWQPVVSGDVYLTQFLRLRLATTMISGAPTAETTATLRESLSGGRSLEIAGYELSPRLAAAIAGLRLSELAPPGPASWIDVVAGEAVLAPASRRVVDGWRALGKEVNACAVSGEPFWGTVEVVECPALIAATMNAFATVPA